MNAYQLKAAIKNQKPTVWRRCIVPGGITYSQLSLVLTEIMGRGEEGDFEFEFYQKKIRFGESREDKSLRVDYYYSVAEASEFYIDELLDTEDWFSFYYGDQLKLRVTIEKRLERDNDEYTWPFIVDAREAVTEKNISESDVRENLRLINESLKKKYTVRYEEPEYKTREQIRKDHQQGRFGLIGWKKAKNDPKKIRYSNDHSMQMMAGILRKVLLGVAADESLSQEEREFLEKAGGTAWQEKIGQETETQEENRAEAKNKETQPKNQEAGGGRISLTERLQWENKDRLMRLGKSLGLSGISSVSKLRLVEKVANCLLAKDVMERYFIKQNERSISAWEAAVAAGSCHQPPKEHVPLLEKFYESYYLAMYEDDCVEVPLSVAEQYMKMNTPEFQNRRKQVSWMLACLHIHIMIYGVAPAAVVMRMYRKRAGYRLKQSEFFTVFQNIPERDNPCELRGDKVINKMLLKDNYYVRIEEMQGPWDFFVPEADEIEDCYENGYPSRERHYRELENFLIKETGWEENKRVDCLRQVWAYTTQGYDSREIESDLKQRGFAIANRRKWKELGSLIEKAQDYTRRFSYRGYMPVDLRERKF